MRTMIIRKHALGAVIVVDAIRTSAHIDLLNQLQRGRVEHRDFVLAAVAGEAVLESGSDRGSMNAWRIGDRADDFAIVGVEDFDLSTVRDVEPARRAVDGNVIKTTDASNRIAADNLVAGAALNQQTAEQYDGQHCFRH